MITLKKPCYRRNKTFTIHFLSSANGGCLAVMLMPLFQMLDSLTQNKYAVTFDLTDFAELHTHLKSRT